MGKRSVRQIHLPVIRNNSVTYMKGSLTSFLMDNTFPEESNDSGLCSDTTFILTDSSGTPSSSESDMENCHDSLDSGVSNPPIQGLLALLSKRRTANSASPQSTSDHDSDDHQSGPFAKKARLDMAIPVLSSNNDSLQASNGNKQQEVLVVTTTGNVAALHASPGFTLPALEQTVIGDRISSLLVDSSQNPGAAQQPQPAGRKKPLRKPSLHQSFPYRSRDGKAELKIIMQPEEQHRARYMTEGSRGSIKDERGSGFPTVKLFGVKQPVTLQVFIGTDQGKVQPHLFYQACKVTGKNCTPCTERVLDGTTVIEITMSPEADMTVSCDCIGILKERNVDVEQRLPYFGLTRTKKKSTRCRMVFRVCVPLPNGSVEMLQIASSQILCTQSPGLPEICKKSLTQCPVAGDLDLFIIGKNFQKDTQIVFQEVETDDDSDMNAPVVWEEYVQPEKEYFHQSHLVCRVPAYRTQGVTKPVRVRLMVSSGGKSSLPHPFYYTPVQQVVTNTTRSNGAHLKCSPPVVDNGMEKFSHTTSDLSSMNIGSSIIDLPNVVSESQLVKMEPLDDLSPVMQMTDINRDSTLSKAILPMTAAEQELIKHHADSVIEDLQQHMDQLEDGRSPNMVETNCSLTAMAPEDVKAATEDCLNQLTMTDVSVRLDVQQQVDAHTGIHMNLSMPPAPVFDRQDLSMSMNEIELPMPTMAPVSQPLTDISYLNQSVVAVTNGTMCHENGCTNPNAFATNSCLAQETGSAQVDDAITVPAPIAAPAAQSQSTNQELNCFNQNMTLEFSQLSDADLLSLINPSTFDNV